jgi:hypothetical protein
MAHRKQITFFSRVQHLQTSQTYKKWWWIVDELLILNKYLSSREMNIRASNNRKGSRLQHGIDAPPPFFSVIIYSCPTFTRKKVNKSWQGSINFHGGERSFPFSKANTCFQCFVSLQLLFVYTSDCLPSSKEMESWEETKVEMLRVFIRFQGVKRLMFLGNYIFVYLNVVVDVLNNIKLFAAFNVLKFL